MILTIYVIHVITMINVSHFISHNRKIISIEALYNLKKNKRDM